MAWILGAGGAVAIAGIFLANWDWYSNITRPDLKYLSSIKLKALDGSQNEMVASELWKDSGVVIMVEASELSSLKPELDQVGVNLVGVVHEEKGAKEFQPYLKSPIFLDPEKKFYGPEQRWMFLSGFCRLGVWKSFFRVRGKGIEGNLLGEGRLLGGVFVVGPGQQGILLDHKEKEFGDKVDLKDVRDAVSKIGPSRAKL